MQGLTYFKVFCSIGKCRTNVMGH